MKENYIEQLPICQRSRKKYPNWSERNDNGEWGIGLDKFDDMYKVILEIIEYTSCDEATEQMLDDILFGIARDNECSRIIEVLLKYPDWYALLCEKVLFTEYIGSYLPVILLMMKPLMNFYQLEQKILVS